MHTYMFVTVSLCAYTNILYFVRIYLHIHTNIYYIVCIYVIFFLYICLYRYIFRHWELIITYIATETLLDASQTWKVSIQLLQ